MAAKIDTTHEFAALLLNLQDLILECGFKDGAGFEIQKIERHNGEAGQGPFFFLKLIPEGMKQGLTAHALADKIYDREDLPLKVQRDDVFYDVTEPSDLTGVVLFNAV